LNCLSLGPDKKCLDRLTAPERDVFRAIEEVNTRLLEMAMSFGQTFIVTNALGGWVEQSARDWMPSLVPLLGKVTVISARSRYQGEYPFDVQKWKAETFRDIRRKLNSKAVTNIVSVGDSEYEMEAAEAMYKELHRARIKLVKILPHSSPVDLLTQLELVASNFERLIGEAQNHRVSLRKPSPPEVADLTANSYEAATPMQGVTIPEQESDAPIVEE
jgi:hypothetical protein